MNDAIKMFKDIIDDFIERNMVQMLITLPEGTQEAETECNIPGGPTVELFILLKALTRVMQETKELLGDIPDLEMFIDRSLELVKLDILGE